MPPFVPTPTRWVNQDLVLYHGTVKAHVNPILARVDVSRGRIHTDYGRGFYTTTVEQQARSWAWQLSQRIPGSVPAVLRFEIQRGELANLEALWFVLGSFDAHDYWSLIFHCRMGRPNHGRKSGPGWHDIVIGPVAASWRTRLTIHDADQVSFHTSRASLVLDKSNKGETP